MATVHEIYRENVRPLAVADRVRLAALILDELTEVQERPRPRRTMAELIASLPAGPRGCPTWEEYEKALPEEKDAWDR